MKKERLILCAVILSLSVCTGCGDWMARMKENWELAASMEFTDSMEFAASTEFADSTEAAEPETGTLSETAPEAQFSKGPESGEQTPSGDPMMEDTIPADNMLPAENIPQEGSALPPEELAVFESFLNDVANNGFLCGTYEDVRQADLNEILYNGAGLEQQPLTDELRQAYEAQAEELFTDTIRLTAGQIDGFLLEKTGYGFAEFQPPSGWTYLETYDIWMTQHGDTNMMSVVCDSGIRTADGLIVLSCHVSGFGDSGGGSALTVTLRETESGCLFVKNEAGDDIPDEEEEIRAAESPSA